MVAAKQNIIRRGIRLNSLSTRLVAAALREPKNLSRININGFSDTRYWCYKFECSKDELEDAVEQVGYSPRMVEKFFGTR